MIRSVLRTSGVRPDAISYVNAHGTGTVVNDEIESRVIAECFPHRPLVNTTKSLIGHTIGAAGAIEAAVTALSIERNSTHICKNLEDPIADLNFVRTIIPSIINYGLSQSFAFGGNNAVLVMKKCT
jgi:3-oxoacyl-(acyl-carrier-protein) synthase